MKPPHNLEVICIDEDDCGVNALVRPGDDIRCPLCSGPVRSFKFNGRSKPERRPHRARSSRRSPQPESPASRRRLPAGLLHGSSDAAASLSDGKASREPRNTSADRDRRTRRVSQDRNRRSARGQKDHRSEMRRSRSRDRDRQRPRRRRYTSEWSDDSFSDEKPRRPRRKGKGREVSEPRKSSSSPERRPKRSAKSERKVKKDHDHRRRAPCDEESDERKTTLNKSRRKGRRRCPDTAGDDAKTMRSHGHTADADANMGRAGPDVHSASDATALTFSEVFQKGITPGDRGTTARTDLWMRRCRPVSGITHAGPLPNLTYVTGGGAVTTSDSRLPSTPGMTVSHHHKRNQRR